MSTGVVWVGVSERTPTPCTLIYYVRRADTIDWSASLAPASHSSTVGGWIHDCDRDPQSGPALRSVPR